MIVLIDRGGRLAQAAEATLRLNLNRGNREFFYQAAGISLRDWPAYRDAEITRILDGLEWFDLWNEPDGDYTIREGMGKTIASKRGDLVSLIHVSARRKIYESETWHRGQPCPDALTPEMIAQRWDVRVHDARLDHLDVECPADCIATWDHHIQQAARACLRLAARGQWSEALEIARLHPYHLPFRHLSLLVEGQ